MNQVPDAGLVLVPFAMKLRSHIPRLDTYCAFIRPKNLRMIFHDSRSNNNQIPEPDKILEGCHSVFGDLPQDMSATQHLRLNLGDPRQARSG
jgi:hypothetical protein